VAKSFGPAPQTVSTFRVVNTVWSIESYAERDGYQADFVSGQKSLRLPGLRDWSEDVITLLPEAARDGAALPYELKYTHFSVVMSRSRKLPLFSAVNIDGSQSDRDVERTDAWRKDPRIDLDLQIIREVYGDASRGFFSRGHMTRREDPNWGDPETAKQADADTFHVTNAAPQQQNFNAGVWLDLESYILDNTDRENLRISVITGPVLTAEDPVYYGVKVPVAFWKIVAFTHARTRAPTAVAYRRSQTSFMPRPQRSRFVFGDFEDTQVSVEAIEIDTGLDLAAFKAIDVMAQAGPQVEIRVNSADQIILER